MFISLLLGRRLNESCTVEREPKPCAPHRNLICNLKTGTCTCPVNVGGYVPIKDQFGEMFCAPSADYHEQCSYNKQCGQNMVCTKNETMSQKLCDCKTNYIYNGTFCLFNDNDNKKNDTDTHGHDILTIKTKVDIFQILVIFFGAFVLAGFIIYVVIIGVVMSFQKSKYVFKTFCVGINGIEKKPGN